MLKSFFAAITNLIYWLCYPIASIGRCIEHYWTPVADIVRPTRAVFFSLLILFVLLFATEQGQELANSLPEDRNLLKAIPDWGVLLVTLGWASIQAWWWSRIITEQTGGTHRRVAAWLPRLYGASLFFMAAAAAFNVGRIYAAISLCLIGIVVLIFYSQRKSLGSKFSRLSGIIDPQTKVSQLTNVAGPTTSRHIKLFGNFTRSGCIILMLSFAVTIVMFSWGILNPVSMGRSFGSLTLALAWFHSSTTTRSATWGM